MKASKIEQRWEEGVENDTLDTGGVFGEAINLCHKLEKQLEERNQSVDPENLREKGMDAELRFILGRPNFTCGNIATRLREFGMKCDYKAEAEQALTIAVMLNFYYKHGPEWRDNFNEYMNTGNY